MFKWEERSRAVNLLYNQGQVVLAASWIAMISIKVNGLTLTLALEHQRLNQSLLQSYKMASHLQQLVERMVRRWPGTLIHMHRCNGPGSHVIT
jgi:hypothetical protein